MGMPIFEKCTASVSANELKLRGVMLWLISASLTLTASLLANGPARSIPGCEGQRTEVVLFLPLLSLSALPDVAQANPLHQKTIAS